MVQPKYLVLIITLFSSVLPKQIRDEPPSIKELKVNGILIVGGDTYPDPSAFVQVLDNSYLPGTVNTIQCIAENAQSIKLQFSSTGEDGTWNDNLPDILVISKNDLNDNNNSDLIYSDGDTAKIASLAKWNGYYRCYAKTPFGENTYITTSPPIRIILPSSGDDVLPQSPSQPAYVGRSYTLPCVRDIHSIHPQAQYTDIFRILRGKLLFSWDLAFQGKTFKKFIEESGGRIKMDPLSGALHYAYLTADDHLTNSTAGKRSQLTCTVKVYNSREKILNDVIDWNILTNSSTGTEIREFEYLAPLVDSVAVNATSAKARDNIRCVEKQLCEVVCIFGGREGNRTGNIRVVAPKDSENSATVVQITNTGFNFTPVADVNPEIWGCSLLSKDNRMLATVNITIEILNYPKLIIGEEFPATPRYVPEGAGETVFTCSAQFANETKFYIKGAVVTGEERNGIVWSPRFPERLTYRNLAKNQSSSILCAARGTAGFSYATSYLIVYEPAVLNQHPKEAITVEKKQGNDTSDYSYELICNATLDARTSEAVLVWSYTKNGRSERVDKDTNPAVVALVSPAYLPETTYITSRLYLEYDLDSDKTLRESSWHCELSYKVLSSPTYNVIADEIPFNINTQPPPTTSPPAQLRDWALLGGSLAGVIFLVLIILLTVCYSQKNKGLTYYVDKNERKAGHDPEEELQRLGFTDYVRSGTDYTSSQHSLLL